MKIDWALIKKPLIFLLSVLIIASISISYLWSKYEATNKRYRNAVTEKDDAFNRYQHAASDMDLFEEYKEAFLAYKASSIIGEENRLSWAEVLHQQNQAMSLANFNVNITPRKKVVIGNPSPTMQWYQSNQNIRSGLLHEGDLYQLLNALQENADGLFRVASCRLLKAKEIQIAPQVENIQANCELEWFSLELSRSSDG